jgi:hypothetical protein
LQLRVLKSAKMGEKLSIMSNEELNESRKSLIKQLKEVDAEIKSRRTNGASSATAAAASEPKVKKVVKMKARVESEVENETAKKVVKKKTSNTPTVSAAAAAAASEPKINATIPDMKFILEQNGVEYSSSAKKDELIALIRANCLIRKAEAYCAERKRRASARAAAAADSD